jgi:hypothetical protein
MDTGADLISLDDRDAWNEALEGIPHAFAHTWESCRIIQLSTGQPTFLFVWEGDGHRVVCPLSERGFGKATDVVTPYGFSGFVGTGPAPDAQSAWRRFAKDRGWVCGFIQMNPLFRRPFPLDPGEYQSYKNIYVFDLRREQEELFSRLPRSRRRAVHRWTRSDATFVDDPERVRRFGEREYGPFLERKGSRGGAPVTSAEAWERLVASPNTVAFGAEVDGELVAVNVLVFTEYAADDLLLVSLPGHEHLSMAFQWEGILRLRRLGIEHLNIGGGVQPGDGVEQFKSDLGAEPMPLGALKQVFDRDRLVSLCEQAGVDQHISYFPPYRAASSR